MAQYKEGTYACKIVGQGFGESSVKKTPYVWLDFEPAGSEFGTRRTEIYLTDGSMKYALPKLKQAGWTGPKLSDLDGPEPKQNLRGNVINLVCKHEHGDEATWEKWEFAQFETEREPVAAPVGLAKRLDALYSKELKAEAKRVRALEQDGLSEPPAAKAEADEFVKSFKEQSEDIPF